MQRSFKTQLDPDLLPLIAESLTGSALTLVIVCVSCAPANMSQTINALEFGEQFSGLAVRPRVNADVPTKDLRDRALTLIESGSKAHSGKSGKYTIIRQTQGHAGRQIQEVLGRLLG